MQLQKKPLRLAAVLAIALFAVVAVLDRTGMLPADLDNLVSLSANATGPLP